MNRLLEHQGHTQKIQIGHFSLRAISLKAYIERLENVGAVIKWQAVGTTQEVEIHFENIGARYKLWATFQEIEDYQLKAAKNQELYQLYKKEFRERHVLRMAYQKKEFWDLLNAAEELKNYEGSQS